MLVLLGVGAVYARTACATLVSYSDSAELVTASYTLGVPHAPGYPLCMMLGKLWACLLPGDVTHRYSLLCGLLGSLTASVVFLLVLRLTASAGAAFGAAFTLAFSYHFWLYGLVPEVSVLHALFVALVLGAALAKGPGAPLSSGRLGLLAFLYGLSLTHHHIMVLAAPALAVYLWSLPRESVPSPRSWLRAGGCFLAGLLPYLYVPLAAAAGPAIDSFRGGGMLALLAFIARRSYGTLQLTPQFADFSADIAWQLLRFYAQCLLDSFGAAGLLLGLAGTLWLWRMARRELVLLGLFLVLTGPFFTVLTRAVPAAISTKAMLEKYVVGSFVVFAILVGCGLAGLLGALAGPAARRSRARAAAARLGAVAAAVVLPGWLAFGNAASVDKSDFRISRMYAEDLFRCVPSGALLLVKGDSSLFGSLYLQLVEGRRPDVRVLNVSETDVPRLLASEFGRRPVCEVGIPGGMLAGFGLADNPFGLAPRGLTFQVVAPGAATEDDESLWNSFAYQGRPDTGEVRDLYAKETLWFYAAARFNKAVTLERAGRVREACEQLRKALVIDPDFPEARAFLQRLPAPGDS
ncbi:MAG: DUF2723 domain-containing protein [Candidatus Riflebacteria bacterium]|nr:DUF2723 domain-containing protein [Candidatus Riflebacteria bacterium]